MSETGDYKDFLPIIEKAFTDGFNVAMGAIKELDGDTFAELIKYLEKGFPAAKEAYLKRIAEIGERVNRE